METNPEYKQKRNAYNREYNQKPEVIAHRKAYDKEYTQKPEVKARKQAYVDANKEHVANTKKQCYLRNKERYLADAKAKYQANKEAKKAQIEARRQRLLAIPVVCECGATTNKFREKAHKKTKSHIAIMEAKENEETEE
jgi:hypothetical protein